MTMILCKIFGHKWNDGIKSTSMGPGEYLGNGKDCIGAIDKCTNYTCIRCGKKTSYRGWDKRKKRDIK